MAEAQAAYEAAHGIEDVNERRRAAATSARDLRYFTERLKTAQVVPPPPAPRAVAFGTRVTSRATTVGGRPSALSAKMRAILGTDRSPTSPRSLARSSARLWRFRGRGRPRDQCSPSRDGIFRFDRIASSLRQSNVERTIAARQRRRLLGRVDVDDHERAVACPCPGARRHATRGCAVRRPCFLPGHVRRRSSARCRQFPSRRFPLPRPRTT